MDRRNQNAKGGRRMLARSVALAVAGAAGVLVGPAHHAAASVIDVVLSRTGDGDTAGNSGNNGINVAPAYTPTPVIIPDAPGQTYDAADLIDPGTTWNALKAPATSVNNTTGSAITTLYQQNIPLVDSLGNSTTALLSISFTEPNGKNDFPHNTGMCNGTNPGVDGLAANPATPVMTTPVNVTGLMGQSWFDNGTTEFINFNMTGLTPGHAYLLYVYGAGSGANTGSPNGPNNGNGGSYTVPAALSQGVGYSTANGAYQTEPNANGIYRSVFDSSGINPTPEEGLTWTVLPVVADPNGDLNFVVNRDFATGSKGYINGFQLDDLNVPEPASAGLLAAGTLGLMLRNRRRRT